MFEDLFGQLQSECGYTPTEVREMTLQDVNRLARHWSRHPPLRAIVTAVAASLGVKFEVAADKPKPMTAEEARRMIAMTGGRIDGIGRM